MESLKTLSYLDNILCSMNRPLIENAALSVHCAKDERHRWKSYVCTNRVVFWTKKSFQQLMRSYVGTPQPVSNDFFSRKL
jgi:hypothetical protein